MRHWPRTPIRLTIIFLIIFQVTLAFANEKQTSKAHYIILYVWDGLRADAVTAGNTPNLYQVMKNGVQFLDNHSSYPTFTMINAASFATGDRAGNTGFYGNTLWHPGIQGTDFQKKPVDFSQPVFTEDYKILTDLQQDSLFFARTLFSQVHEKHLSTITVGKSGPSFMQDYLQQGIVFDEKHISPLSVAKVLQEEHYPLPKNTEFAFKSGAISLAANNGDPTAANKIIYLSDSVTTDPTLGKNSPFIHANRYMMNIYLNVLLPKYKPTLSIIWMRNPDTTEHIYGPGTQSYYQALHHNDQMLGQLIEKLKNLGIYYTTDILIGSDHGHSNISGPLAQFPLRDIHNALNANGYSVSGAVRVADMLTKAGFHAYDGDGCRYNPVMSGIERNGTSLLQTQFDKTGKICHEQLGKYTTPAYKVPKDLPKDAIIVASNGGSDYYYLPSHDKNLVKKLIVYLQSHEIFDVIFVDSTHYGELPGTLPLMVVKIQNTQGRSPDVVAGFSYNVAAKINGLPGIEFSDSRNERGMHGSFSPIDVHNFLAASGPDFKKHFVDSLPTGNVDVAPTIAYLLGFSFQSEGRVLYEALQNTKMQHYIVKPFVYTPKQTAQHLKIYNLFNQQQTSGYYQSFVYGKNLSDGKKNFLYFDSGIAKRSF